MLNSWCLYLYLLLEKFINKNNTNYNECTLIKKFTIWPKIWITIEFLLFKKKDLYWHTALFGTNQRVHFVIGRLKKY